MVNMNDIMGKKDGSDNEDQEAAAAAAKKEAEEAAQKAAEDKQNATSQNDDGDLSSEDDPYADWTRDQIVAEMKSSRQEAAKNRVEKKETERALLVEQDAKIKALEDKFSPFMKKAKELDKLKEKEADQKRSDAEKIAARETRIEELLGEQESVKNNAQERQVKLQSDLEKASAQVAAYETYWKEQLEKELAEIPQKHKNLADMMVKGAGDTREALDAIKQAKSENLFGNKKVTVYNGTPTAKDGARMNTKKAQDEASKKLSAKGKIGEGLKSFKDKTRRRLQGT